DAYDVSCPLFDALGVSRLVSVDGRPVTSDEALHDALATWFTASATTLGTPDGERTWQITGAPTTAPPGWSVPLDLSVAEQRTRAGIVASPSGLTVPRQVFAPLMAL